MFAYRFAAVASLASLALVASACGGSIEVHTMAAPDAGFRALHTYRILPEATRRDGQRTGAEHPMISNSIANRAIREQIVESFKQRGYRLVDRNPDFAVAFYATAKENLDVMVWDYGYPFNPDWPRYLGARQVVSQYTEGSVIVDVIKPGTRTLLWRGEGIATLTDDPSENVKQLAKAAEAIVARFPLATSRVIAFTP